jgi:hypothetical protein
MDSSGSLEIQGVRFEQLEDDSKTDSALGQWGNPCATQVPCLLSVYEDCIEMGLCLLVNRDLLLIAGSEE